MNVRTPNMQNGRVAELSPSLCFLSAPLYTAHSCSFTQFAHLDVLSLQRVQDDHTDRRRAREEIG